MLRCCVVLEWHRRRLEPSKAVKPASNLPTSARRRTLPEEEDMHEIIQAYTKMALERTGCIQELAQKRVLPHSKKRPPSAQQRVYMPTSRIRRAVQSAGVQRTVPAQPSLVRIRVFSTVPTATTAAATPPNHALVAPVINSAATTTTRHATPARMLPPRCMSAKPRRRSEVTAPRPQSAHPRSSVPAVINRPTVEVAENGKMKLTVHMTHIRMENNDGDDDAAEEEVEGDD
ncbi:hypothetical protein DYB26_010222 [Aphanomyces astaci]|uniref:Uncharacterized protein n=1 Tax=Aphanomyces astaci TaxID=112090 RepID=A0A418CR90_APHAT|nr:hypothetical protein DYB26_010222 [Aphanomyces astaci]